MARVPGRLRRWVGLGARGASAPGEWVEIVSHLRIDDPESGGSSQAERVCDVLAAGGVETNRRSYVLPDSTYWFGGAGPKAADRLRVAVLVRRRDLDRGNELLDERDDASTAAPDV